MYQSIQACRALAALLVVFFHLGGNLAKDKYFGAHAVPLQRIFLFGGSAGVAFFFVLSGFIIVMIHWQDFGQPARLRPYLRKRLVRIYPTYILIFCAVYAAALLVPSLRDAMPTDVGVLLESLLLVPQDVAMVGGTGAPVIVVAWSLQYEVVFYAVVALAFVHPLVCAFAVLALAGNFVWQMLGGARQFPASFFANELMLLFAMGVGAAAALHRRWQFGRPLSVAILVGVAFFAIGAASVWRDESHNAYFNLGYGVCGALAIVALTQAERAQPARFASRMLSLLGDASYALYLIHFPLIAVLCKLAVAAGLRGVTGVGVAFVAITLACVATSVAFHLWIERPMLRLMSGNGGRKSGRARCGTT
ncbi:acyltransferase [Variovorax sp. J22R24]|uniref:acyltransferase family protein n=1 Tax=Variovorax gracilis TaxID=3053502 RepID=UPI002578BA5B|nr:acyltransferase [Variovorax sp. J22R24]MDM0109350.1 acyltransferase [Variovorax sp. J22R24]